MKFLSLLGAVYGDWFTVRKKFTICVAVIFFLASFVMTFTASLVGGTILWTDKEIEGTMQVYLLSPGYPEKSFVNSFIDNFSALEKGNVHRCSIEAYGYFTDKETGRYTLASLLPYYAEDEGRRDFLSETWVSSTNTGKEYYELLENYTVSDGRLITDDDFNKAAHVIVIPKSMGFQVGDTVSFSNCILEVVGLTEKGMSEIPATTLEEIYNDYKGEIDLGDGITFTQITDTVCYRIGLFIVNEPLSEENRAAIETAVSDHINDDFSFTQHTLPDNDLTSAYIMIEGVLGGIVALFSILCVYNVAVRLCASAMPMLQLFKLCGMKRRKVILILFISLFSLLAVCFGLACLAIVATKPIVQSITDEYVVRNICFALSAVLMTAASLIALLPRIIRLAGSKISTSPGGDGQ